MTAGELWRRDATELAALLRARALSAREVMAAHLERIAAVNPALNAIVTLDADRAMAEAAAADDRLARGEAVGILHGLPIAHKDLLDTAGMRTTYGSPLFRDHVPAADAPAVARAKAAGAIAVGKTNTPEWGAGSQTFNAVFGATPNPWNAALTCGGSSGGSAVALATGMTPLADGTDVGGSLRNPASFCGVVGMRTSPGLVPVAGSWSPHNVAGPMARTVADLALLLDAHAGFDLRAPLSFEHRPSFQEDLGRDVRRLRVAWAPTLGGLPVDPRVLDVLERQRTVFEACGWTVVEACPPLTGADEVFETVRAHAMAVQHEETLRRHAEDLKATVRWNIKEGLRLTAADLRRAERLRAALFAETAAFFEQFDLLACTVSQVPPFDIGTEYPESVAGMPMASYIEWMRSCSRISATAHPAIAVPAGLTADGLPAGIQLVGRYRGEQALLGAAATFERARGRWPFPPDGRSAAGEASGRP